MTHFRSSTDEKIKWLLQQRSIWNYWPTDWESRFQEPWQTQLKSLAMQARNLGMYSNRTYIKDVMSSLWTHIEYARKLVP